MADIELIIKMPEEIRVAITRMGLLRIPDEMQKEVDRAIQSGTPIPDNATVGDVFCMLACKEPICETASCYTIDKNLWNSPYQKDIGGK